MLNGGGTGSLTPIDPRTAKPGKAIPVDDPYNLYFTPDGNSAIVVAEAQKRLDFRDPHTMVLQCSITAPLCAGINHADFSIDGRYALFTCDTHWVTRATCVRAFTADSFCRRTRARTRPVHVREYACPAAPCLPRDARIALDARIASGKIGEEGPP